MAALSLTGGVRIAKNHAGSLSICYIKSSKYSTECKKNFNQAAWKRGTGGRSSFNGIVATVFGSSGFVGRYLCNKLGKIGTQLILPHRCDHYDMMRLKLVGDLGQVLFQEFDLRDQAAIEKAIKYSNVVVNLIGRDYETSNFKFDDVHVKGARNIARACTKMGVDRLIHLSYLNSEEHPESPLIAGGSKWKRSKWLGEQVVREEFPDVTIIKASDIYGNEDRFLKALSHWYRRQDTFMPLWENGTNTFKQPVYVSDVAQGLVNVIRDPETRGQVYQAVGPKRYQMGELVDWLHRLMRKDKKWGYYRYNMKYDLLFQLRVTLNEKFSPAYPLGYLHWESLEREITTDKVIAGVPTLEDLGVTLTEMETQVPWELHTLKAYNYYHEELGEFEKAAPPPTVPLEFTPAHA